MQKLNLAYLTVSSAKSYSFYMIPKELIDNPAFDDVDCGSKVLYGMMLNRASLSATNPDFIDGKGNVYIIYTVEQVMAKLRCSTKTAVKMFSQLENIGLIERIKHGQGRPATIYVKDFSTYELQTCKKDKSDVVKNTNQEMEKVQRSNTDVSKTDCSNPDTSKPQGTSIYPPNKKNPEADHQQPAGAEPIDTINNEANRESPLNPLHNDFDGSENPSCEFQQNTSKNVNLDITKEQIADKIDLHELISDQPDNEEKIVELYDIICDVLTTDDADKIRVAKKQLPAVTVKQEFLKLTKAHIIYVLDCLEKNGGNIRDNSKGYILTSLYNSNHSIGYYKPHSQSAFADKDKDNSKPKGNGSYNVADFFERRRKNPVFT
jgi:hypothetical protein